MWNNDKFAALINKLSQNRTAGVGESLSEHITYVDSGVCFNLTTLSMCVQCMDKIIINAWKLLACLEN